MFLVCSRTICSNYFYPRSPEVEQWVNRWTFSPPSPSSSSSTPPTLGVGWDCAVLYCVLYCTAKKKKTKKKKITPLKISPPKNHPTPPKKMSKIKGVKLYCRPWVLRCRCALVWFFAVNFQLFPVHLQFIDGSFDVSSFI